MTIIVENNVRDLLPEVAIDFLREIISKDDTIQTIRLIPIKLSCDYIQEIILENKNGIAKRRVFGFAPIKADLIVSHKGGETVMRF